MARIALIMAMEAEAAGIARELKLRPRENPSTARALPFVFRAGHRNGVELILSTSGKDPRYAMDNIGLESAALQAFVTVHDFLPDLVINAGTAGSFASRGAAVGDVFLSHRHFVFHDHRIPLGDFARLGRGEYPSCDTSRLAKALGLKQGIVSSGSSLDYTEKDLEVFHAAGATLKEMEGTAIAQTCFLLKKPFFAVKSVTNLIDVAPDSAGEFERNFGIAVASLTASLVRVADAVTSGAYPELLRT